MAGLMFLFLSATTIRAQAPVAPTAETTGLLSPDQLDQLLGPIALYPDPLIAEILPASTLPNEIVMADRYVSQGGDPNQVPDQGWDPSVQALAHYPNVLKWMDDNLAWTTQLGQAFQAQQPDVMDAIQRLRGKAQSLGNLPSTQQESVVTDDGDIEIEPTDPDQMYVPEYQPDVIYYQPGIFCTFPFWLPIGGWLVNDWNWHGHGLIYWGPGHQRPGNWWHESPGWRHSYVTGHTLPTWHAGAGIAVGARGGWQRGFESAPVARSFARPAAPLPREPAPRVEGFRSAPVERQAPVRSAPIERQTPVRSAPIERQAPVGRAPVAPRAEPARPEVRSAPSADFFGGGQTGHEAVQSSSRGEASRAAAGGGGGGGRHP
jgi:hypothetical protein